MYLIYFKGEEKVKSPILLLIIWNISRPGRAFISNR